MITIKVDATLPYDNEIQFFDVCAGIADKLQELAQQALDDGDCEQFVGQTFTILAPDDDQQKLATIRVEEKLIAGVR